MRSIFGSQDDRPAGKGMAKGKAGYPSDDVGPEAQGTAGYSNDYDNLGPGLAARGPGLAGPAVPALSLFDRRGPAQRDAEPQQAWRAGGLVPERAERAEPPMANRVFPSKTQEPAGPQRGGQQLDMARQARMQDTGVSNPIPEAHGRGRRYIEHEDHRPITADLSSAPAAGQGKGQGRRSIIPSDHGMSRVLHPSDADVAPMKRTTNGEMKEAIKEWLLNGHDMVIFDEDRWNKDVVVQPRGAHWALESLTDHRKTLSKEGRSARCIADRLSMMPIAELRHYGVRFATQRELQMLHREKRSPFEDNPTLVSPGVHTVLGHDGPCTVKGSGEMSSARKAPEAVQRRYIASGTHNFESCGMPASHGAGHRRDTDFSDGIERGIGKGRRHNVGPQDSMQHLIR
eukprot:CAMPEP_0170571072 /NCGR_PEP_ID=MMETSP0224-20130122/1463_1 /TAXON_ID=285029 /ORGANISM="Togula jolla, Strain CCCM 725" /LENGTH=399 /DNA_ID=CAMNT_0010893421 /DNA_START=126 /DNA_END=1325 /DNA_ORIENTATION=+